jgi:hypothetical protein
VPLRSVAILVAAFCLFAFSQIVAAAPRDEKCELPSDLQHEIVIAYPGAKLVNLTDLSANDRVFFQKDHGDACPGIVNVDFYGDGKPTLALVLVFKKDQSKLVLAHYVEDHWKTTALDKANGAPIPVIWSQPPGEYTDFYGNKHVKATKPVIVFTGYEAWSILYAWTGTRVTKIWLRD